MNTIAIALSVACFVACVAADCYREVGCSDSGKGRVYRLRQKWRPSSNVCYTCKCIKIKVTALTCKVAAEEEPTNDPQSSLKKSGKLSARFEPVFDGVVRDKAIEITEEEAEAQECPPTPELTFNWATMTFESVSIKTVSYFYKRRESRCCSRFMNFTYVHPSCKVMKVGKCRSKLVKKSNPRQRCNMAMSLIG